MHGTMESAGAALVLEGITRRFGDTQALRGVTLTLAQGEITCLLGQSGCGKSSLLRIISGVDAADSGRILIGGVEVAGPGRFVEPEKRNIGFMFQDYALFPHLTVEQNVGFGLRTWPRREAGERITELLDSIGIGHLRGRHPHTLSGGEQQRVALARALAPRPVILLMDEPFSNLDRGLREYLREETIATLRKAGTTTIMVTHDPEEALATGDRVVLMQGGAIIQAGTPREVFNRPISLYAAEFMCPCNRIPAVYISGRIETPLGAFPAALPLEDGAPAIACVRPQALSLAANGVRGRIRSVSFLGEIEELTVLVEGIGEPLRLRTTSRVDAPAGTQIHLAVDPHGVLAFEKD